VFLPHIVAYFERDKADKAVDVRLLIVEQPPGLPFNRGLMKNVGFQILRQEIDYVCFHDVDYLPMWADYSYSDNPSMLIGYGLEPAAFQHFFIEKPAKFFSAVVLLQNAHVERVNGYSNDYWGWGHEDLDFLRRLDAVGLARDYRYGTFTGLDHDRSDGHSGRAGAKPGQPAQLGYLLYPLERVDERCLAQRWPELAALHADRTRFDQFRQDEARHPDRTGPGRLSPPPGRRGHRADLHALEGFIPMTGGNRRYPILIAAYPE
jgi:hypothetical protein